MASPTRKTYKSIRVFQNPYLEKLTHVHPIMPLVVWAPILIFLYYRSLFVLGFSWAAVGAYFALGLVVWTLTEYLLHRWVFHFKPWGPISARIQFLIHGLHHDDPNDPTRLVMPPAGSLILAVILFSGFRGIFSLFDAADAVEPFFASFVIGYLSYDYTHYGVHHFQPRSKLGKMIKQHHMIHHFVAPELNWGVSSPIWDYALGTVYSPKAPAKNSSKEPVRYNRRDSIPLQRNDRLS